MTTYHICGSLFADADNINIDNKNRVLGRDRRTRCPRMPWCSPGPTLRGVLDQADRRADPWICGRSSYDGFRADAQRDAATSRSVPSSTYGAVTSATALRNSPNASGVSASIRGLHATSANSRTYSSTDVNSQVIT